MGAHAPISLRRFLAGSGQPGRFLVFSMVLDYRRDCAAPAAHFFFNPVLLSLSCVQTFSANDTAPIFFFVLPKKKTAAGGQKKKGALCCLSKGTVQPCFQVTAGARRASSEGLCAPPDAQPLTLAVCAAWQSHCRFHSVRLNGEKAENLLKRPAPPRRTTRDSAMSPGLPGSAAERPERHKRPLDMKNLFLLYRVAAFFFS